MLGELVQQIMQEGLDGLVHSQQSWDLSQNTSTSTSNWKPSIDILENDDEISIFLSIPGVKNSSIDIDILNNRMLISGERETPYSTENFQIKRTEIIYGRFQRTITIPISVTNQSSVSTQLKDGILKVKIDKRVEQQNRFSIRVNENENNN